MKKKNFLFVLSDSVIICNDTFKKRIVFEEEGISSPSYEVLAAIIADSLRDLESEQNENVLVLNSQYIHCTEKITTHVKKDQNEADKIVDFETKILNMPSKSETFIFNEKSAYIFQGNKLNRLESIPLLQKYYLRRKFSSYSTEKLTNLLNAFVKYQVEIDSVLPFAYFATELSPFYKSENPVVCVELDNNCMTIAICNNGVLVKTFSLGKGIGKVVEDVSNTFNISNKVATKLVDLYGFVFLPMIYLDVIIDIPIYGDLVNSIALPDLSYRIRESFKQIIDELIVGVKSATNCDSSKVSYIIQSDFNKQGLDQLMKLMLNENIIQFETKKIDYNKLINTYEYMICEDTKSKQEYDLAKHVKAKPALMVAEEKGSNRIVNKLAELFNEKLKPLLAESDQF